MPTVQAVRTKATHRVKVLQAPRRALRQVREMLRTTGQTMPKAVRPTEVAAFDVSGHRESEIRKAIHAQCAARGLEVRSLNRSVRGYLVYTPHPEDTKKNATPTR